MTLEKENLPIYGIAKAKHLADFCTTEKDVSRGISRVPMMLARLVQEDVKIEKQPMFVVSPKNQQKPQLSEADMFFEDETVYRRNSQMRTSITLLEEKASRSKEMISVATNNLTLSMDSVID